MAEQPKMKVLAESENYTVWVSQEPDQEEIYHIELGNTTYHLFPDEWEEFAQVILEAVR
jgi:hypothetical protein